MGHARYLYVHSYGSPGLAGPSTSPRLYQCRLARMIKYSKRGPVSRYFGDPLFWGPRVPNLPVEWGPVPNCNLPVDWGPPSPIYRYIRDPGPRVPILPVDWGPPRENGDPGSPFDWGPPSPIYQYIRDPGSPFYR